MMKDLNKQGRVQRCQKSENGSTKMYIKKEKRERKKWKMEWLQKKTV